MSKTVKIIWISSLICLAAVGGFMLLFFSSPYDQAKSWLDPLAKDGSFDALSLTLFTGLRVPLRLLGGVFLLAIAAAVYFRAKTQAGIQETIRSFLHFCTALGRDSRLLLADFLQIRRRKTDLALLLVISLCAVVFRVAVLAGPMRHDEAYTFEVFAFRPLWGVLSDYHLPNNHIFHSILVHFASRLFGIQPWVVRLPAFLAGVLLVPAGYLLARSFYDRYTALVTAGLLAAFHTLIHYSANARGYSLVMLFTVLILALGAYAKNHKNRAAWLLIVILSTLGFYTLPVMLYPFGLLLVWLLLSTLVGDISPAYRSAKEMIAFLIITGIATALLSALLYFPVVLVSGVNILTGNTFVSPLTWNDFIQTLPIRLGETWREWSPGNPVWGILFLLAFSTSLGYRRRISQHKFPLQAALILWIIVVLLVQRPNAWSRTWTFLLPLFLMWTAAGIIAPLHRFTLSKLKDQRIVGAVSATAVVLLLWTGFLQAKAQFPNWVSQGEVEQTALYLQEQLNEEDIVVVTSPSDAELWYYFHRHDIPKDRVIGIKEKEFDRAFIVVNPNQEQTLESVIQERGPDLWLFDLDTARLVQEFDSTLIYECLRKAIH